LHGLVEQPAATGGITFGLHDEYPVKELARETGKIPTLTTA
jgi:hypothetical protein